MKTLLRIAVNTAFVLFIGTAAFAQRYTETKLVSNTSGVAEVTDPQLVNPSGFTRTSGSPWWVSDNQTGFATLYNGVGVKQSLIVTIPPADPKNKQTPTGSPTANISNSSLTDFLLAPSTPAIFIFATADGTIAAWNQNVGLAQGAAPPSTHAVTVVKTSDGSVYTGLTSGFIENKAYLYAANFAKGRVDVYDNAFHPVDLSGEGDAFVDNNLPRDFMPFNVQNIGNDIVVTYALHQPGEPFETDGPGMGYVDIYSTSGRLLQRLEHGNWLNAPWGVALAPLDFGRFSHQLLVGQFAGGGTTESSGNIAAYDLATGKFDGLLQDANGAPLSINGIRALSPSNVAPANADPDEAPAAEVYFTAGPNNRTGGLFGYLNAVSTDLTEGNAQ
jgi:uncharacterized protein (TIGR03118 family)